MQNQQDTKCDAGEKKCGKKQDWLWGCEEGQGVNCGGVVQDTKLLELLWLLFYCCLQMSDAYTYWNWVIWAVSNPSAAYAEDRAGKGNVG